MGKGALDDMVVRIVANLASVRLARLPNWVEVKQGDGLRRGTMRMRPIMEPRPVFFVRVQVEGGPVLSRGIRSASASHPPAQLHIRCFKLLALLLELVEERARLGNGVGNGDLKLSDSSRGSKVPDNVHCIALLETNEGGCQKLLSDIG